MALYIPSATVIDKSQPIESMESKLCGHAVFVHGPTLVAPTEEISCDDRAGLAPNLVYPAVLPWSLSASLEARFYNFSNRITPVRSEMAQCL